MPAEETNEPESTDGTDRPAGKPEPAEEPIPRPTDDELPAVVEALLFATTTPLSLKRLQKLTGETPVETLEAAIGDLKAHYDRPGRGLMLLEVAGGYQLATRKDVSDWVLALHKHRRKNPISPAMLETLAIVAYKQPLVRAEIEAIRGVDCGGVMRALQDSGLVDVLGQKEVPGRPSLYGTSELFLKTFGLKNLEELPSLGELQKILTAKMKDPEERDGDSAGGEAGETTTPEAVEPEPPEAG